MWFQKWRTRNRRAIFTMVRDESVFLPIWLRYYAQHFAPDKIFVFDHGSRDGSVTAAHRRFRFRSSTVEHPAYNDFPWYTAFIQDRQRELLQTHDVVVFAEADEILWHPFGLEHYLASFGHEAICATGWNLWHDRTQEPDLDLTRRILRQRRYWVRDPEYDKALITRRPLTYEFGFHKCHECEQRDPALVLLHLHRMDFRIGLQKHERTRAYGDYSRKSAEAELGFQGRLVGDDYAAWFDGRRGKEDREVMPWQLRWQQPV